MTKYEEKIYNIINASTDHMTTDEIYKALKEIEPKVVLATVYNNVNKLVKEGKVIKLSIEGQVDRYDKLLKHDHLICSECGKIGDFTFTDFTEELEEELGEVIEGYDLRIHYVCKECREKNVVNIE